MVEPISMIAGASLVSLAIGRLTNSRKTVEADDRSINFVQAIRSEQYHDFAKMAINESVFININPLFKSPDELSNFLYDLEIIAKRNNLQLKQISPELLFLASQSQSVKTIANRQGDTISASLTQIMAG